MKWLKQNIISILLVLIILCQNPIWPLWQIGALLSFALVFLIFIFRYRKINLIFRNRIVLIFLFLLITYLVVPIFTGFYKSDLVYLLCYLLIFTITSQEYANSFVWLSKIYAVILLVSFIPWLINTFVAPVFPVYSVIDLSEMKGTLHEVPMLNHFFFVENGAVLVKRFYSMFDEPGVVGTLSAFILFGLRYNFRKWYTITILFVSIFTFSLAFYILTALGYFYFVVKDKQIARFIIPSILLFFILYYLNETNETFRMVIMDRLFDRGLENSLDHRTSYNTQLVYDSVLWTSDFFIGLGKNQMDALFLREGASYKVFILERGFLATLSLLFAYCTFVKYIGKGSKDGYMLLFIFILSFLQRPKAFTAWQMFLFCGCVSYLINCGSKKLSDSTMGK